MSQYNFHYKMFSWLWNYLQGNNYSKIWKKFQKSKSKFALKTPLWAPVMPKFEFEPSKVILAPFFSNNKYWVFKIIMNFLLNKKNPFSSFLEFFQIGPLLAPLIFFQSFENKHDNHQLFIKQKAKNRIKKAFLEAEI